MALFKILKGDNALPKDKHDGWAYVRKTGDETADFYVDYSDTVRVQIGKYAQNGMYYINGTGTTAGTWLGTHQNITEYYDGLAILYRIPIAGASTTTLNINGLGAKTCYLKGTTKLTTHHAVNALVLLVYDSKLNSNAGGWSAHTYHDTNTIPTAYCSTSAGTAAKTASQSSFKLKANSFNVILITNANTAAGALTLNINSTGAKAIWINGKASSAENYTLPAGTYLIFYDGSKYLFYTDNTIPAKVISAEKVNQATDTTNKDFPVLLRALDTSNTTESPAGVIFNTKIKANPSTGALSATYLYRNGLELTRIFGSLIPYGTRINPTENIVLNDPTYLKVGNYYCSSNATAKFITDLPKAETAFMMQVLSPLNTTIDNESSAWVYRIRIIRFYTGEEYVQSCYTNAEKVWSYGSWKQTIDSSILASTSQNGLMTSTMVTKLNGIEAGAVAKYHTRVYDGTASTAQTGGSSSNVKITNGVGVEDIYVPIATGTTAGLTIVYPSASCTTYTSDKGAVTPKAAKQAVDTFAITLAGGGNLLNSETTQNKQPAITWSFKGTPYIGYAQDQTDGTFIIGSIAGGSSYTNGLAIGGGSGNLLWKGKRVLTMDDYTDFTGATAAANGVHGLVPAPTKGQEGYFLRGNGSWYNLLDLNLETLDTLSEIKKAWEDADGELQEALEGAIGKKVTNPTPGTAVGSTTKPVYVNASGEAAVCSTYAGGTKVTLNGSGKGASTASFYAPTAAGTKDQYLRSTGAAPAWTDFKTLTLNVKNITGNTAGTKTITYNPLADASIDIAAADLFETYTFEKRLILTQDWIEVGINGGSSGMVTGSYIIQIAVNDRGTTGGLKHYSEIYTGTFSWFDDYTNSADEDEIVLHKAGHASNGNNIYLRTKRKQSPDGSKNYLALEISCNTECTVETTYTITARRLL